jgi:hypothetical protein
MKRAIVLSAAALAIASLVAVFLYPRASIPDRCALLLHVTVAGEPERCYRLDSRATHSELEIATAKALLPLFRAKPKGAPWELIGSFNVQRRYAETEWRLQLKRLPRNPIVSTTVEQVDETMCATYVFASTTQPEVRVSSTGQQEDARVEFSPQGNPEENAAGAASHTVNMVQFLVRDLDRARHQIRQGDGQAR